MITFPELERALKQYRVAAYESGYYSNSNDRKDDQPWREATARRQELEEDILTSLLELYAEIEELQREADAIREELEELESSL